MLGGGKCQSDHSAHEVIGCVNGGNGDFPCASLRERLASLAGSVTEVSPIGHDRP